MKVVLYAWHTDVFVHYWNTIDQRFPTCGKPGILQWVRLARLKINIGIVNIFTYILTL